MKKISLFSFVILATLFLSGCSDPVITERGHNTDWNEGYDQTMIDLQ